MEFKWIKLLPRIMDDDNDDDDVADGNKNFSS